MPTKNHAKLQPPFTLFFSFIIRVVFLFLCAALLYAPNAQCFSWQALAVFNITLQFHVAALDKPLHIIVVDICCHKPSTNVGKNRHLSTRCSKKWFNEVFLVDIMTSLFENLNFPLHGQPHYRQGESHMESVG